MKKLFFAATGFMFALSIHAQDSTYHSKTQSSQDSSSWKHSGSSKDDWKYCAMTSNGKIMVMWGGKALTADVTLKNGTKVSTDGTVTMKDGSKKMLKDGDCIDKDGMIKQKGKMN